MFGQRFLRGLISKPGATILLYHDPHPDTFNSHLRFLSKHYQFVSLSDLVSAVQSRDTSALPPYPLVITFDDGFRGNHDLLALFQQFGVHPTIYLCSHIVDSVRAFWFKTDKSHREILDELEHNSPTNRFPPIQATPILPHDSERQALSLDELRALQPHVEFGAHTRHHPILPLCNDEICRTEMQESKTHLEALLKIQIHHFAYPFGDYGTRELEMARQAGFHSARTTRIGHITADADVLQLPAMPVEDDASVNVLCGQAIGLFGTLRTWFAQHLHQDSTEAYKALGIKL